MLNDTPRRECASEQFDLDNWQHLKSSEPSLRNLIKLLQRHHEKGNVSDLKYETFLDLIERENKSILYDLQGLANVTLQPVDRHISVFFWLIDGVEAIFALASHADVEYGFRTKDPKLISALQEMRDGI